MWIALVVAWALALLAPVDAAAPSREELAAEVSRRCPGFWFVSHAAPTPPTWAQCEREALAAAVDALNRGEGCEYANAVYADRVRSCR